MTGAGRIAVGRVYDPRGPGVGRRVLVDRLWPRGLRRDDGRLDQWLPGAAPSTALRRWYGHRPEAFPEFARRYRVELATAPALVTVHQLLGLAAERDLVLLTATRQLELSAAAVLRDHLQEVLQA